MVQNIVKLAVGCESLEMLHERQSRWLHDYHGTQATRAWTSRRPREHEAIAKGGSIYWVIKNHIIVRQAILGFEPDEEDDPPTWSFILDPALMQTIAVPRKAFQGWRYLPGDQAPPDRRLFVYGQRDEGGSREVEGALRDLGLL